MPRPKVPIAFVLTHRKSFNIFEQARYVELMDSQTGRSVSVEDQCARRSDPVVLTHPFLTAPNLQPLLFHLHFRISHHQFSSILVNHHNV